MKALILLICLVLTIPAFSRPRDEKEHFPFYKTERYGKYRTQQKKYVFAKRDYKKALPFSVIHDSSKHKTKKNKRVKQKEAWIHRQWTRN